MEALNIEAEYREFVNRIPIPAARNAQEYADAQVRAGKWVEDDGDYYTREEWDSQYAAADTESEDDCPHDNTTPADDGEPYQRECSDCDARLYLTDEEAAKFAARDDAY